MKKGWYLTLLASAYLVICTTGCIYYASLYVRQDAGTVPFLQQALCLGYAIAALLYFVIPRSGHAALTALTVATLIAIGTSEPSATAFHACVLMVLLVGHFSGMEPTANNTRHGTV